MKRVTWKQIAAMAMCLLMLVIILPSRSTEAASSTAPAKITEDVVVARIKKLQTAFSGKYFTTTQKSCGNSHCTKCNAGNVIKQAWVKSAIDLVPKSLSMAHYYYSGAWTNGWSCCGFANFAGWYIFAQYLGNEGMLNTTPSPPLPLRSGVSEISRGCPNEL